MSRFVLRSNADGTKLSEQKERSKPLLNPLRTPPKKSDNKRTSKICNITKEKSHQSLTTTQSTDIENESEIGSAKASIICSLPLSRLSGFIGKLSLKTAINSNNDTQSIENAFTKPTQLSTTPTRLDPFDDDDGEEKHSTFDDDTSNSHSKSQDPVVIKTLCLYCDKKFSTHKMQQKHIEKFHSPQKDRRCSVRNSQVVPNPRSKSISRHLDRTSFNKTPPSYPGCTYCKKVKPYETSDPVRDFNGLFLHLTENHADKYFGCKICILRFQNIGKLVKHMQNVHHTLPEAQLKLSKEFNDISDETSTDLISPTLQHNNNSQAKQQQQPQHHLFDHVSSTVSVLEDTTGVIGAEDTILSRLGLTQNRRRMPSNRKGVRLRRDSVVSDVLLKNDAIPSATVNLAASPLLKTRNKPTGKSTNSNSSELDAIVFRVPARTDASSAIFDENFYKEVTSNVRNNLLFHLDGKLENQNQNQSQNPNQSHCHSNSKEFEISDSQTNKTLPLLLRSTLACTTPITLESLENSLQEPEIHVATNLPATTAFPTLLTAEQYCGDVRKIRRPHTKHSWKWKWDSVKKYKLINEGGKFIKKAKHPMLGLRDLSKLDMWTQLSMRQKHEKQLIFQQHASTYEDTPCGEKRRLNEQLNAILDTRVLPHIILEQSEEAIIKLENEDFNFSSSYAQQIERDDFYAGNIIGQTFADENFPSLIQLLPRREDQQLEKKIVLSGEWARPRCYLCMCCGNKFEKLKSLEEHKMFRHSNILSTHYEVVGRELLAGNLLQHLFIPKRALSYYGAPEILTNAVNAATTTTPASTKKLIKYRRINISAEEESSDSVQSISNSYPTKHTFSLKNNINTTDECDTDTKTTLLGDMNTVSPSHSLQSSLSSSLTTTSSVSQGLSKTEKETEKETTRNWNCSKCNRKCNSMSDLYRHMLDCSGDYIWSMAKKRKYRYYCGSKKRRPLHKQSSTESRKNKQEKSSKSQTIEHCTTEESSSNSFKPKTPPRPRPSDAESIKKMLENLPPKRVCKKIFPTVNKTKKTRKQKFITKLYNTKILRKTRARQLSNAVKRRNARFAVKTQNQHKSLSVRTSKPNKKSSTTKQTPTKPVSNSDSRTESPVEKRNSPKKEQIKPVETDISRQEEKSNLDEKLNEPKKFTDAIKVTENFPIKPVEKDTQNLETKLQTENVAELTTPTTIETTTQKINNNEQKNSKFQQQKESERQEQPQELQGQGKQQKIEQLPKVAQQQQQPQQQQAVDNNVCGKKRSKRISDCIAMLTGKLEEKLKTESNVNNKHDETTTTEIESKTTQYDKEKKTPKRKAISRRIIKPDIALDIDSDMEKEKERNEDKNTIFQVQKDHLIDKTKENLTITTAKITTTTSAETLLLNTVSTVATTSSLLATPTKLFVPPTTTTTPTTIAAIVTTKTTTTTLTKALTTPIVTTTPASKATKVTTITPSSSPSIKSNVSITKTPTTPKIIPTIIATPIKTSTMKIPLTTPPNAPAKVILPPPLTPPTLVSIPIPISTTMHAVPMPLKVLQNHLPVFLPVQQIQQNLNVATIPTSSAMPLVATVPTLPLSLTNQNTATGLMPPLALLPPPPLLQQAHVSPALTTSTTTPLCSMEPLNLSNAKGAKKQTTAELRAQRPGGIPARRQTICGFEARDLFAYNDMEPLDLSKKSRDPTPTLQPQLMKSTFSTTPNTAQLLPPPPLLTQQLLAQPVIHADEISIKPASKLAPSLPTLPAPTAENIFSKQFYSNLELLKIPQIRATGFTCNPPSTESIVNRSINTVNMTTNLCPATETIPPKVNKKRANTKANINNNDQLNSKLPPTTMSTIAAIATTSTVTATTTMTTNTTTVCNIVAKTKENSVTNKKEAAGKNKPILKMDEEVINHIDDAINSVINAVKASIYETEENEFAAAKMESKKDGLEIKTTNECKETLQLVINKENSTPPILPILTPTFALTPKKRNLRSKTLDCRSQIVEATRPLARSEILCSPILQPSNVLPNNECAQPTIPTTPLLLDKPIATILITPVAQAPKPEIQTVLPIKEIAVVKPLATKTTTQTVAEMSKLVSDQKEPQLPEQSKISKPTEPTVPVDIFNIVKGNTAKKDVVVVAASTSETNETLEPALQESNINLTIEENISNINNTSSGFHSSSTPENGGDVKKKQRRRRKNELAAIVADQLLESFKIDKARRDSLKKLENLAYEKSDDLLITGMLLMSSTKRIASSTASFTQGNEKRSESAKRQKQEPLSTVQRPKSRNKANNDQNSAPVGKGGKTLTTTTMQDAELDDFAAITPRRGRRRQTRSKGAPLDNENLSRLKSSLESFSIGIEKQLSEIEARNTQSQLNANESKSRKNLDATSTKPAISILRPSILSATLEHVDCIEKNASNVDGSKSTNFSRDPRLNKNIHKDENASTTTTSTTIPPVVNLVENEKQNVSNCELEDDNYLTEIAKNVNEKIMSAENEDFVFADDGFEIGTEFNDDSNSKFSRPPTSMSVRSAPNFNDDHSNFGSICDENTNTEVMDMDLDDELSVYTSFSQDLGRGRGRKRRRRRSILLKRRPKKRRASHELLTEKFECELCKKTFFTANSLAKHNMTLAHVSKVSEREYLLSKSGKSTGTNENMDTFAKYQHTPEKRTRSTSSRHAVYAHETEIENVDADADVAHSSVTISESKKENDAKKDDGAKNSSNQRLSLNPDERLFYECCNILKSADTTRLTHAEQDNENPSSFMCPTPFTSASAKLSNLHESNVSLMLKRGLEEHPFHKANHGTKSQETSKYHHSTRPSNFHKTNLTTSNNVNERPINSPTYSQFSVVTNTTSRFKTKAAMKGYENGNLELTMIPSEAKSRPTCKLTELADIALGHDDKPETAAISSKLNQPILSNTKRVITPEYVTLSVADGRKGCNFTSIPDNKKSTETQGSTSSKTIMHSSIIKAAVEEHGKTQTTSKIVIPERPFKNIGLEEKETITFQKPKTSVNLLIDDNSVSTASYSDRDDFDFNSMSCDEEVSNKTNNDKNLKSNTSDSSSSRATAKTFENKSLIMGRIFKNASTKAKTAVKSIGVQKDTIAPNAPKADLNQLFDELRGDGALKDKPTDLPMPTGKDVGLSKFVAHDDMKIFSKVKTAVEKPNVKLESKRKTPAPKKSTKATKKAEKEFSKLQSEHGMSQAEIEKLIDEGQRKSKRRCATNRSKKLVETWSSDEYEEFLSTKDIIALIEEKEKQEQRKKRKSDYKEKSLPPPPALSERSTAIGVLSTEREFEKMPPKKHNNPCNSNNSNNNNQQAVTRTKDRVRQCTNGSKDSTAKDKVKHTIVRPQPDECTNISKSSRGRKKSTKITRQTSNRGHTGEVSSKAVFGENDKATDIEVLASSQAKANDNLYLLDIKQNNNNNSRKNKTKKVKSAKESVKEVKVKHVKQVITVNNFKSQNRGTQSTDLADLRKRNCNSNTGNNNVGNVSNKKTKGKRKPQADKSPVRKRQAAEKLYYWSSSSDEDFGRINEHEPEIESNEQYQKHGWIVGDSHKKLVTLLAIAKGNKKGESCGVKKNVSKRKN